jgi:hypothetical protein
MGTDRPRPRAAGGQIVVLLEGDASELPLLSCAATARQLLEAPAHFTWMGGSDRAARHLLGEIARQSRFREISLAEVGGLLASNRVELVMLAQRAWRRYASRLWRRIGSSSLFVCRLGVPRPRRLVCCADTAETARCLLATVASVLSVSERDVTVVHADPPPPLWAQTICAMSGVNTLPGPAELRPRARWATIVVDWTAPETAVQETCKRLRPDLVVLGWHRHALPVPDRWLHPTAWRLSTQLPHDVLLVPLG